jgi:membrane fusion protein (multidrug efflux system)
MKWLSWLGVVVACLGVTGALGLYKYNEIQAAIERGKAFPEPAEAVEIYVVKKVIRHPSLSVTGEVVASQSATLQNELSGRIVSVGFKPGSRVYEGQVLLQLDISQEQARLAESRAEQQIAKLALDRAQRLVKSGAGSVENRDQARAQFDAARARVSALSALIEKKTLRAPFDAVTSLHQLEAGQFLEAGTEITELVGASENVWIDFSIPQENAGISVGSSVEITLGDSDQTLSAQVIARDASINVRSRNLGVRAQLAGGKKDFLPGMLVRVTVPLGDAIESAIVPATAVRRDALGPSVYILENVVENGETRTRARKRKVLLATVRDADLQEEMVVVLSGLEEGEEIAAIGAFKLRDGSLVVASAPNSKASERVVGR